MATWIVQHAETVVKERPLEVATAATGGLYESTVKDASIEKAIDKIGGELHAEYTISYRPTGTERQRISRNPSAGDRSRAA